MTDLLHEDRRMGMSVRVFSDRVEVKSLGTAQVIPLNQIASVTLALMDGVIETSGGKRFHFRKSQETLDAINEALSAFRASQGQAGGGPSPTGVADEIAKLAKLRDDKILSDEEFESQKKRLLQAGQGPARPPPSRTPAAPKRRLPPGLQVVADVRSGKGSGRSLLGLALMAIVLGLIIISALSH